MGPGKDGKGGLCAAARIGDGRGDECFAEKESLGEKEVEPPNDSSASVGDEYVFGLLTV